eukprot:926929-Ditylum_brightwellii.AAC.1
MEYLGTADLVQQMMDKKMKIFLSGIAIDDDTATMKTIQKKEDGASATMKAIQKKEDGGLLSND